MDKNDLESLIERIRALPPEKLEELQEAVEWIEADDFFEVPPEAWPGIERGLAAIEAGDIVPEKEMAEFFAQIREGRYPVEK